MVMPRLYYKSSLTNHLQALILFSASISAPALALINRKCSPK